MSKRSNPIPQEHKQECDNPRSRIPAAAAITAYAILYLLLLLWGRFFLAPDTAGLYSLCSSYLTLPLAALIVSIIIGKKTKYLRFVMPIVFTFAGWLLPLSVFGASGWVFVWAAFIPSIIGAIIGGIIRK